VDSVLSIRRTARGGFDTGAEDFSHAGVEAGPGTTALAPIRDDPRMSELHVEVERQIGAQAEQVYRCIADFREHHPKFLPDAFSDLRVEEGGVGAGTVFSYKMTAGGRTRAARIRVEEPEPGRVLTESELGSSLVTTWTVTPEDATSRVRVVTRWQGAGGVGGFFERLFAPRVLTRLYNDELERLDRYARGLPPTG